MPFNSSALVFLTFALSSIVVADAPIAYSYRGDIWTIDPTSLASRQLTSHPAIDHAPSWHPNGESLIFMSTRNEGRPQLYSVLADGSNVQPLGRRGSHPAYAADGIRIAYVDGYQLVVAEHADDNPFPLLTMTAEGDVSFSSPSWSPLGDQLVFGVSPGLLYIFDAQDAPCIWEAQSHCPSLRRLVHGRVNDSRPAWSPLGDLILFQDHFRLSVIRPDGTGLHSLTPADLSARQPTWSPDARSVAFVGGDDNLYVMDMDGTDLRQLTFDGGIQTPAWRYPAAESQTIDAPWAHVKDSVR